LQTGYYNLVSCPPGFSLQVEFGQAKTGKDGVCELCSAGYFCSGGSFAPTPCPTATYSLPGCSITFKLCTSALFVIVWTHNSDHKVLFLLFLLPGLLLVWRLRCCTMLAQVWPLQTSAPWTDTALGPLTWLWASKLCVTIQCVLAC
jgi:hypothetical protein